MKIIFTLNMPDEVLAREAAKEGKTFNKDEIIAMFREQVSELIEDAPEGCTASVTIG